MLLSPCNFGESKLTNFWGKSQNVKGWFKRPLIAQIFDFFAQKAFKPANYRKKTASYQVSDMPKKHFESAFGHNKNYEKKYYDRNQIQGKTINQEDWDCKTQSLKDLAQPLKGFQ